MRRDKLANAESLLTQYEEICSTDPSCENKEKLELAKNEYNSLYEHLSMGAIIRSRARWYEFGEKSNKYFLSLETSGKSKSSVRKVFSKDGFLTTDPRKIMAEVENYYTNLYKSEPLNPSANLLHSFLGNPGISKLSDEEATLCEGKLTASECFKSLQSFQKNKSPGNDGLTVEFYIAFWDVVGDLLVDSLNCSYDYGELSNSQKQAIITLLEKKDKDKRKISNWRPISLINVDAKIGSKAIALRLQIILPSIIHYNESAYVEYGGLKAPHLESIIKTQRIMCCKKIANDQISTWKTFLLHYLKSIGGKFILCCDFDLEKLQITLPKYYKECFECFVECSGAKQRNDSPSHEDISETVIWNNRFICIHGKSLYNKRLVSKGIIRIGDFISEENRFITTGNLNESDFSPLDVFEIIAIIDAIPCKWREILKTESIEDKSDFVLQDEIYLRLLDYSDSNK